MNTELKESISTPSILIQSGYRYIELIGEGANGKTYKAKNLKTGEIVAIKALKFSENLKDYELFRREAETMKSIHTPGCPVFYEYITGKDDFTECWIVQEFVEGESILDKLETMPCFSEVETLKWLREAADIVRMLHTLYAPPIIHRDIKPSNILMRDTPKDGYQLCLIDFGAVANPQKRSSHSTVAGTVGYMAPEQLLGDCALESDYYALGATALHMLTGTLPGEMPADGFLLQFEDIVKSAHPDIHPETLNLLHKLLSPHIEDRPHDANELLQVIDFALDQTDDNKKEYLHLLDEYKKVSHKIYKRQCSSLFKNHHLCLTLWASCMAVCVAVTFHSVVGLLLLVIIICLYRCPNIKAWMLKNKLKRIYLDRLNTSEGELSEELAEIEKTNLKKLENQSLESVLEETTQGTIAAVFDGNQRCIAEYTFTVNHKSYTGVRLGGVFKVGDKVTVHYRTIYDGNLKSSIESWISYI